MFIHKDVDFAMVIKTHAPSTDLHFRLVMRVSELCVQNKTKRRIVFDLLVAHLDCTTFLDGIAADDWIQHWIDRFLNVLDQNSLSHGHGALDNVQIVLVTQSNDRQTTSVPVLRTVH